MAGSVLNVKPNGNITNSGFGAGPNPADLGDGSDLTGYISTTPGAYFVVTCTGGSLPSGSVILSVTPKVRLGRASGTDSVQYSTGLMVLGSPFVAAASTAAVTTTPTNFTGGTIAARPDSGAAWSLPDLSSLIFKCNGPSGAVQEVAYEASLDINYVHPTVPSITSPGPTSTKSLNFTMSASVTDAETGKTQLVHFQIASDAGFTNILEDSSSATQTGALSSATFSKAMVNTLPDSHAGVKYYMRARTEDSTFGSISDWSATTIFYVNQATDMGAVTGMPTDAQTGVSRTARSVSAVATDPDSDNWTLQLQIGTSPSDPSSSPVIDLTTYPTVAASGAPNSLNPDLTVLAASTKYYWWMWASDTYSTPTDHTKYTAIKSFTTTGPAVAPTVPALPNQLGGGTVTLAWTPNGSGQTAYAIRRKLGTGSYEYWTGSGWSGTETKITSVSTSVGLTGFTTQTLAWSYSVKTWNLEGEASVYATDQTFFAHAAPTCTVTAPTAASTISAGGPTTTVTWTYAQAQSIAQAKARVIIKDTTETITYFDSGLVAQATASMVCDLVAGGCPTDTTSSALKVRVYVESADGALLNVTSAAIAFDVQWGVITLAITSPATSTVTTSGITATWTFSSTRSKTQAFYRVRLFSPSGSVYYDSGWVSGAATSLVVPVLLQDNSVYKLGVQTKNSSGVLS